MANDWRGDLEVWLSPFLLALRHKARMRLCPAYIAGLIGPGDRKSAQPMAARDGAFGYDQLHHFVADGVWESAPLEAVLLNEADRLVGNEAGYLVIDDTALPKKGSHSVGVAAQYASSLGKTSNCQSLVSVTLASREVPVMVGLRLFLPESWTADVDRMDKARVPPERRAASPTPDKPPACPRRRSNPHAHHLLGAVPPRHRDQSRRHRFRHSPPLIQWPRPLPSNPR